MDRKTFFKVRDNRVFDNFTTGSTRFLWLSHQSAHTTQLTNLFFRTTGSRIQHHKHWIETLTVIGQLVHYLFGNLRVGMGPDIDNLIVTFVIGNETHVIVVHHLIHFTFSSSNQFLFVLRTDNVT